MIAMQAVFFGPRGSGKTSVINMLQHRPFQEKYVATIESTTTEIPWDNDLVLNAQELNVDAIEANSEIQMGFYCVNLTEELNWDQINEHLEQFRQLNPQAALFLLGTAEDQAESLKSLDFLCQGEKQLAENRVFIVSAKTGKEISLLRKQITSIMQARAEPLPLQLEQTWMQKFEEALNPFPNTLLLDALDVLGNQLYSLSKKKREDVAQAAYFFVKTLQSEQITDAVKLDAIRDFETNCTAILRGPHPVLKAIGKAIAVVVVTAAVAVLVAAGFAACVALGLFTVSVLPVLLTTAGVGATVGALTAYGLFKPSPLEKAVEKVVHEAEVEYSALQKQDGSSSYSSSC